MQVHQEGHTGAVPFVIWLKMVNGRGQIKGEIAVPYTTDKIVLFDWTDVGPEYNWFHLAIKAAPRTNGHLGDIQVRLNGVEIGSKRMHWGENHSNIDNWSDKWRLSSGIYIGDPGQDNVVLFLDDIKLGSSWQAVSN
ncbi:MAG: hypothetical protein AAGA64_14305 [Bacteroidota bacterium]